MEGKGPPTRFAYVKEEGSGHPLNRIYPYIRLSRTAMSWIPSWSIKRREGWLLMGGHLGRLLVRKPIAAERKPKPLLPHSLRKVLTDEVSSTIGTKNLHLPGPWCRLENLNCLPQRKPNC